ncbi:MAG: response regulator [SAR324 cluster bacterium]|nr:response regulator [SAR324 cluster bacterium]
MSQVLVVDDSSVVRMNVEGFLTENGFTVTTAINGLDGLSKLQADKDIKLVITDISMPEMDGITMVEKIRTELNDEHVNILVFTNENDMELKKRCKKFKIKGWIVKPFNGPSALPVVQHLVNN